MDLVGDSLSSFGIEITTGLNKLLGQHFAAAAYFYQACNDLDGGVAIGSELEEHRMGCSEL